MSRRWSTTVPLSLLFLVSLSGCIANRTLASNAMSYNLAVEKAQNRMLLTNIIRASNRSPMYITDVSKVTGSIKSDVSTGASIALGAPENGSRLLTPSTSYSVNPTFDVNVLSTQEFMRGFLLPVQKPTLGYYLDQGWPPELLLHLLVSQVRVRKSLRSEEVDKKKFQVHSDTTYDNYPDIEDASRLCQVQQFSRWLAGELLGNDLRVTSIPVQVGKDLSATGDLAAIVNALKEGLSVESMGTSAYLIRKFREEARLTVTVPAGRAVPVFPALPEDCSPLPQSRELWKEEAAAGNDVEAPGLLGAKPEASAAQERTEPLTVERRTSQGRPEENAPEIAITLRSPEGVLYYLGQLQRIADAGYVPLYCIQGRYQPIFLARSDTDCTSEVQVDYDEKTYAIARNRGESADKCASGLFKVVPKAELQPACTGGRSMQALSLVSQLVALHKSAKDLPTTDVVRVIGQ